MLVWALTALLWLSVSPAVTATIRFAGERIHSSICAYWRRSWSIIYYWILATQIPGHVLLLENLDVQCESFLPLSTSSMWNTRDQCPPMKHTVNRQHDSLNLSAAMKQIEEFVQKSYEIDSNIFWTNHKMLISLSFGEKHILLPFQIKNLLNCIEDHALKGLHLTPSSASFGHRQMLLVYWHRNDKVLSAHFKLLPVVFGPINASCRAQG